MNRITFGAATAALTFGMIVLVAPAANATDEGPGPAPTVTVDCAAVVFDNSVPNQLSSAGLVTVSGGVAYEMEVALDVQTEDGSYQDGVLLGDVSADTPFAITLSGIPATVQASPGIIVTWYIDGSDELQAAFCRYQANVVISDPVDSPPRETENVALDVRFGEMKHAANVIPRVAPVSTLNQDDAIGVGILVFVGLVGGILAFSATRRRAGTQN